MSSASPAIDWSEGFATFNFVANRADGSRYNCVRVESAGSTVIQYDPRPLPALPQGFEALGNFLDAFDQEPDIAAQLPHARRARASQAVEAGEALTFRHLRLTAGLSQKELAELLNTSQAAVSAYENRTRKPSEDSLRDLSKIFNVDFNTLMQALANGQG